MSENIPESIPTSSDPRSRRPLKRRALSPTSAQAAHLSTLFANPTREIHLPASTSTSSTNSTRTALAPPEIVANVQGSSAGAGSGEFHVYKASRRREYERLRAMEEEAEREKKDGEFEAEREEKRRRDEERTEKNRRAREKARARKGKGKKGGAAGGAGGENGGERESGKADGEGGDRVLLKPNVAAAKTTTAANGTGFATATEEQPKVQNSEEIGIVIHDED